MANSALVVVVRSSSKVVRRCGSGALALVLVFGAVSAKADTVYSNVSSFSGSGAAAGGATTDNGALYTKSLIDDITAAPGFAGDMVNSFSFSVANFATSAVTADPIITFYQNNAGTPGAVITSFAFNAISFTAGSVATFTFTSPNLFVLPSGQFWIGTTFSNFGATATTAAQLNELGLGIFGPPTTGSSADLFFQSTSGGAPGSNPAGSVVNFGGNPPANFGYSVSVAVPAASSVPEPSSLSLLVLGVSSVGGLVRRKLRKA